MFVYPAKNEFGVGKVLNPETKRFIRASGAEVPETIYWMRRLRFGDVTLENLAPTEAQAEVIVKDEPADA